MTQEELDALMGGDVDLDSAEEELLNETSQISSIDESHETKNNDLIPPPPSQDNKMVEQLDDVTKESEKNASEIFDSLDIINEGLADVENNINDNLIEIVNSNIDIFDKLSTKFPQIETFKQSIKQNKQLQDEFGNITESLQTNQDEIMVIMDKMQFQDIHRQKIERVINIMRSLANYMNHLFSSSIDDSRRVSSAKHIPGDNTEDLVGDDDIEALINSFGTKK